MCMDDSWLPKWVSCEELSSGKCCAISRPVFDTTNKHNNSVTEAGIIHTHTHTGIPTQSYLCSVSLLVSCHPSSTTCIFLIRPTNHQPLFAHRAYAIPYLWNQLPSSLRQPHSVHSLPGSHPAHITSSQSPPSLSSPITSSTFHSRHKTHLFHKSFPP